MRLPAAALLSALAALSAADAAWAQAKTPDPAAEKAFAEFVKAYRARKPFETKMTLVVEAGEGERSNASPPLEATMSFDPASTPRRALLSLRGFNVLSHDGRLDVWHSSNEDEYVSVEDDGSPYYALLSGFVDLPYPHIGLILGEEDPAELLPQLCSRVGWIVPTGVEMVEVAAEAAPAPDAPGTRGDGAGAKGSDEPAPGANPAGAGSPGAKPVPTPAKPGAAGAASSAPGVQRRRFHLTSDFEDLTLDVDPVTHAITEMRVHITGGPMVPEGSSLKIRLTAVDRELTAEEAEKAFTFDVGERRRIDSIGELPRATERGGDGGGGGGAVALTTEPTLVGQKAPDLALPRLDDGELDLSSLRGHKVVVLDFWATWCGPCRVGLPMVDAAARRLAAKGVPVVVAGVNTLEGLEGEELRRKIGAFWREKDFSMMLALDETGEAAEKFAVRGIPATFVIGLDGIIHWQHVGLTEEFEEELVQAVESALKPFGSDVLGEDAPKGPHGAPDGAPDGGAADPKKRAPEKPAGKDAPSGGQAK